MHETAPVAARPRLLDLLTLEEIDRDLYRAGVVFAEPWALYGGQVAAQALMAAGRTVEAGRAPHSLHGYFLRGGATGRPTIFRVERDRDGRSFSARRVVAVQGGEVILNMSASFHTPEKGQDAQVRPAPAVPPPADLPEVDLPRLSDIEGRRPPPTDDPVAWPTRIWVRCAVELPDDPLLHTSVLTYMSDLSSGLRSLASPDGYPASSLDHSVWFHRPAPVDDWILMDLVPRSVAGGRGWYTGSLYDAQGILVASLAQESLFRRPRG